MPDQRITDFSELTTPATTDIVPIVQDPAGTPQNKYVSRINFVNSQTKIIGGVVHNQLYISGGFKPTLTNGCADWAQVEMTTNKNVYDYLAFDKDAIEYAYVNFGLPADYTGGSVYYSVVWMHPSTTTNFKVAWGLQGVSIADDETGDVANGTAIYVNDTGGTTYDIYTSPLSAAVTLAGTPGAGELAKLKFQRYATDGTNDTLAVDAYFLGIMFYYPVA